jgi:WD40 repeat protein
LAGGGGDYDSGFVKLWDVATGEEMRDFAGHAAQVLAVCFTLDGQRLASAGLDGVVRIWDASTGAQLHALQGHLSFIYNLAFSDDDRRLISAGERTVMFWDVESGQEAFTLQNASHFVALSPNGQRLLTRRNGELTILDAVPLDEPSAATVP